MPDKIELLDPTLKELLRQGFVLPHDPNRGLIVLVRGKAGTGKSTLALQILDQIKTAGPSYYCTLEQSKMDLQEKCIAMRIAKALHEAQIPQVEGREFFVYEPCSFAKSLKKSGLLVDKSLISRIKTYNASAEGSMLPLYYEPKDDQRKPSRELYEELIKLAMVKNTNVGIEIIDDKAGAVSEGPFEGCHSRLLMASRILQEPLRLAGELKRGFRQRPQEGERIRDRLPIVVLDGLSLLSSSERDTLELQSIVEQMRQHFQLGILVYEPSEHTTSNLDHHVDMVIDLERNSIERPLSYLIHEMCIRKARYQDSALGNHQFKIRESGLMFFPSLHFQVHHYNYMDLELKRSGRVDRQNTAPPPERVEYNSGSLVDLIFSPIKGESMVLLGPRNSFKTQITLDFFSRGNWGDVPIGDKPEQGLLISLIDNAPHIQRGLKCPCLEGCHNCTNKLINHARAFCQRPGYITPAEFFYYVQKRIKIPHENNKIERVAFWDLTQMDYRFPLFKEDKMLLPALMDCFKTNELKSLFMGAGNAENTKAASAMADHVLFCWRSYSKWKKDPLGSKKKPVSSLMLYVDRTSVGTGKSGKALYALPVYSGDDLGRPRTKEQLDDGLKLDMRKFITKKIEGFVIINNDDSSQMNRIAIMQGVQ